MKAIRVYETGAPEVMKFEDAPELAAGAGEILVRLHAAGVNPVDTYLRSGAQGYSPALPYTPGIDGAGVVASVGPDVAGFAPGTRVYVCHSLTGTYAEYCLCKAEQVHPLPEAFSYGQGAAIGVPYGTAHRALFARGNALAGETVLVHGASGGVGTAAIQLARAVGLRVFGTAGSEAGLRLIQEQGVGQAFDHRAEGYQAAILEATGGKGVDVIVEMLANVNLGADCKLLAPRGRAVVVGSRGPVEINARDLMTRNADIRGLGPGGVTEAERIETFKAIDDLLAQGALQPVVGKELPLAEAPAAHDAVINQKAYGKIVLAC